jgi:hypothetical protein
LKRLVYAIVLLAGCKPDFGAPLALVTEPRVLAVRGVPAEAPPGAMVTWDALVGSSDGVIAAPALDFAFCRQPKPLTENDVVPPGCVTVDGVEFFGATGPSAAAPLPDDACRLYGPDVPPAMPGAPPLQPRNPDVTGGYYQPVRVALGTAVSYDLERLHCNLAGASLALAQQYSARYMPNQHPVLVPLQTSIPLDAIPAGAKVTLTVGWTPESAETYPVLDLAAQALVDHREALRVSYHATAGTFDAERTGRDETDPALTTTNVWTAPSTPGVVHLFLVLRDSRGGTTWSTHDATVTP